MLTTKPRRRIKSARQSTLSRACHVELLEDRQLLAVISINDPTPLAEGNAVTVDHIFTVSLANPSALSVTVVYATVDVLA
jgi:hypothetical protein